MPLSELLFKILSCNNPITLYKLIGIVILSLFLPLTALTYHSFRRRRREKEIKRIAKILNIEPDYIEAYYEVEKPGRYLFYSVVYAAVVSFIGLTLLFLGAEIRIEEFQPWKIGSGYFPAAGSRLVFGMAFLGAYIWGLQHIHRRFFLNDLSPAVYYHLSIRMIFAALIALVIYNVFDALSGSEGSGNGITSNIWPALAFLIGMFPQRGLRWLTERIPVFSPEADPSVRKAPLEMIEGITIHDRMRLEELGIDTCYDLATYDLVPLVLRTPYRARELADWILQAKLCVHFGEAVRDLRQHGIRSVIDLRKELDIEKLAQETAVTRSALKRAQESIAEEHEEIDHLCDITRELSKFSNKKTEGDKKATAPSA
ncbi:MAG: hypothetical protein ACE5GF_08085 [Thermodesulfobacteriota bacterium]